jgi:hypothetical protein
VPDTGADVYSDLVKVLLDAEATRKTSLEQKGTGVITTAATLVTLLFGLVATITNAKTFVLPSASHGWLAAAVVAFVGAAALAIFVALPVPYGQTELTVADLSAWWNDSVSDAEAAVAGVRLQAIAAARRANSVKGWLLLGAGGCELVGLASLTAAVIAIITSK